MITLNQQIKETSKWIFLWLVAVSDHRKHTKKIPVKSDNLEYLITWHMSGPMQIELKEFSCTSWGKKPVPVPLCLPQTSHGLTRNQTDTPDYFNNAVCNLQHAASNCRIITWKEVVLAYSEALSYHLPVGNEKNPRQPHDSQY